MRREELAALAGVSVTWYTWLEQGRDIRTSLETLERIAVVLRLTETDTTHLFFLAGVGPRDRPTDERRLDLDDGIRGILEAFRAPAFIVGPSWDVEVFNDIADCIYGFRGYDGPFGRNHIWRFFMDEERRQLYLNWAELAETAVGLLRTAYARRDADVYFDELVQSLVDGSPQFRELWDAQRTAPMTPDRVQLVIPALGEVHVMSMRLPLPGRDDHVLFLLPPVDEESARLIASLSAPPRGQRTQRRRSVLAR